MARRDVTTMGEAFVTKFPYTAESIANELGMAVDSFRVWKNKLEKASKLTKPAINGQLCIQDPESKNRLLYSEDYVNKLRTIREQTPRRNRGGKEELSRKASLRQALMTITVPIHDENIVAYVKRKFKDETGLEKHLKNHIKELAVPALSKIEELKRKHQRELDEAMENL